MFIMGTPRMKCSIYKHMYKKDSAIKFGRHVFQKILHTTVSDTIHYGQHTYVHFRDSNLLNNR
jgi:hypothetical protein